MDEKRFTWLKKDVHAPQIVITDSLTEKDLTPTDCYTLLNELHDENKHLKRVIAENEKIIQSTYDELTKLRCIKKNLRRIKTQWDWIMEAIQYD